MKKVISLICMVCLLAGCGNIYSRLEKDLTSKVSKYYEKNLKNKIIGINQHKVDLTALANSGVSIKEFTDEKCDITSYALVILTLDKKGKVVGDYKVENHLVCGKYETEDK